MTYSVCPELQKKQSSSTTALWIHKSPTRNDPSSDASLSAQVAPPKRRYLTLYSRSQIVVLFLFFCLYLLAFCNRSLHPLVDSEPCAVVGNRRSAVALPFAVATANWSSDEQEDDVPLQARVPHFQRTRRHLPQCIIIGVRKCGTRALLEFLNLHPQIQKAAEEVHFFDDERRYGLGLDWYRRRMPYTFPEQITIEKSPAYFVTPKAPSRIRAMNDSTRLLVILRDPVVRVISDYAQIHWNRLQKGKPHVPFEKLVLSPNGQVNAQYKAIQISMYSKYLKLWYEEFPREQVHIVSGDAFIQDPLQELRKIEDFLQLEHKINKHNFYFNKTKGFYCLRNETTEKCLSDTKGRKHPVVSEKVVKTLRKFFKPYNDEVSQLIGRDMGWKT